jgi:D-sedoheptulose 7-phosphate isomerase
VAIAISTSGNSPNVLAALDEARARGLHTLGLAGNDGGKLAALVDVALVVPSDRTDRIQEAHITALHALCEAVDDALYPESAS